MRRIHLAQIQPGPMILPPDQAHHLRDVLRLTEGDAIEVFDDIGHTAQAIIARATPTEVVVEVETVQSAPPAALSWIIASAIPKGSRVDWMIEKLSELGTAGFIPLAAARSVVLPEGTSKRQRWVRLAAEAAKQSHRTGVMQIEELASVDQLLARHPAPAWYFSTAPSAIPLARAAEQLIQPRRQSGQSLHLLIGPEGGWTDAEIELFRKAGLTPVSLGATILRIETAAVAAAAVAAAVLAPSMAMRPQTP
ncbi:MAG: RsmE family RNA methyltransferase [Bacillota bacterium]